MTMTMTLFRIGLVAGVTGLLAAASPRPVAVYKGDRLVRPEGYREWVFVGSSLGLSYAQNPDAPNAGASLYHNVYMEPQSYREFVRTGTFPDGTVMVMELASADSKHEPGLQGSYQKSFAGLEASVKDSARFKEGWGYFLFGAGGAPLRDEAAPMPASGCWQCHHEHAATDHVFTQYYPILSQPGIR